MIAFVLGCAPGEKPATDETAGDLPTTVVFETNIGKIVAELDRDAAPETVRHFVTHVRSKFYDGVVFHRVEPGFVIQAGGWQPDGRERNTSAFPVANENPNGLSNTRGTIAMARTSDPHSGLVDFFISLVDNSGRLDFRDSTVAGFGYVVFGNIVEGMDVVDSIARIPTVNRGRGRRAYPIEDVIIEKAYLRAATP
jgi:cyclophilin family peptidyl-prolyl cis-trans isomerase